MTLRADTGVRQTALPQRVPAADPHRSIPSWRPPAGVKVLLLCNVFAATFYVAWWVAPGRAGARIPFLLLMGAEAFGLLHLLGLWAAIWATAFRPPPQTRTAHSVDVFIPTCGEPLEILRRTIEAAVAIDGPHRTIVCDDAARQEVLTLARSLGAEYRGRVGRRGAKAGNLNDAMADTAGDLVVVFDADHVPRRDFLTMLLGYFEDERVGFVQTPQFYANAADNAVARGAFQQQAIFYGPICRGKSGLDSAFCCGTNVILRRAALEDVGGFDERSVVEDFVTSMRIHRRGWKSVYFPYVLAEGQGPSTLGAYFRQQYRWARGSVGALFSLEPFRRGFSASQRLQYLLATTFYMIGLVTPIYVVLPILYLLFGWSAFSAIGGSFVFFYAPYLLLALITLRWGLGGRLRLEHLQFTYGAFPVYAVASLAALLHIPARFRPTGRAREGRERPPLLSAVTLLAFVASGLAVVIGVAIRPINVRTVTNIAWAGVNMLLLSGVVRIMFREVFGRAGAPSTAVAATIVPARALASSNGNGHRGTNLISLAPRSQRDHLVLPEHALRAGPEPVAPAVRRRERDLVAVASLTGVGLLLRLALVSVQSLRLDESASVRQASLDVGALWSYLAESNVHVPAYHTLLHFWIKVAGTAEWAIRMPSVILGTLAIPLMYALGRRFIGRNAAVFAAAIGAVSPFWVWHSDEARMYPLLLVAWLGATLLLVRAVERGSVVRWALYGVAMGASFYVHYFALLMPLVHAAYLVAARARRRQVIAWMASGALAALAFAPWVAALYFDRIQAAGLDSITNGIRPPPADYSAFGLVYAFLTFFVVFVVSYHGAAMLALLSGVLVGSWPLPAFLVSVRTRRADRMDGRTIAFLVSWLALTVGVVFAVNVWKPGVWFQKYLIGASPALFFLMASGVARLVRRRRAGLAALCIVLGSIAVVQNFEVDNPVREDYRSAAALVERNIGPEDGVVVLPVFNSRAFKFYFPHGDRVWPILSPESPPEVVIAATLPAIAGRYEGRALWVVTLYERTFDPANQVLEAMDLRFLLTDTYRVGAGMRVRRYLVPEA